jgi:hypothetical protein
VKYKGVVTCTPAPTLSIWKFCDEPYVNGTVYELIEFVEAQQPVHEWTVEIMWKVSKTPQVEEANPSYGLLDSETGDLTLISGSGDTSFLSYPAPLASYFWVPVVTAVTVPGFPPDSSKFAGVECRTWSTHGDTPIDRAQEGVWHWWFDKVTNLLVENRIELNTDYGSVVWIVTLYETNIPVGNQVLVSVETYPSVVVAVAVVCLAAVGFVMFRKRTAIVCGQCGRKMRPGSKFCDKCGARMPTPEGFHT